MDSTKENMLRDMKSAKEDVLQGTKYTKEAVMRDIRSGLANAEELLRETASSVGEGKVGELADKLKDHFCQLKERLQIVEEAAIEKTKVAADAADDFVHEHPWKSVGIAAGVGLIIGLLIGRR